MARPLPPPILLPTPRVIRATGGSARRPAWIEPTAKAAWLELCGGQSGTLDAGRILGNVPFGSSDRVPDDYELTISRDERGEASVRIRAQRRGARHAVATLLQLLRQYPADLPCLEIEDEPAFPTRGVMLDISRDKVPTMPELKRAIDLFASLKLNHLQLYTEHTFAYAGHQEVWRDASPVTPAQAGELDHYCAARGIELAANQNCFGHLAHWLKLPRYSPLAEILENAPWKFLNWERRGPFSLCPTEPKAEAFVRDLLGQLLPCFKSPLVNIGCDETFDVGWGRSRAEAERRGGMGGIDAGRADLYFEFVKTIAGVCEDHGKRPMMWADIALSHPEMLHLLPRDMIGLAWWYEPTDKFEKWVGLLRDHGHEAWVCPGTSSWRSITGRTAERRGNIADAAEQGARAGATGFLVCDWGDLGHRQQWPIALAGLAHAAEAAWNPAAARAFDPRATSLHVLDDPSMLLGPWLDELGDADLAVRRAARVSNASALFNDLHPPVPQGLKPGERAVKAPADAWMNVRDRLDEIAGRAPIPSDPQIARENVHTLAVARFAADHAIAVRADAGPARPVRSELAARLVGIIEDHRALWLLRNRPGGLGHSCSYYESLMRELCEPFSR